MNLPVIKKLGGFFKEYWWFFIFMEDFRTYQKKMGNYQIIICNIVSVNVKIYSACWPLHYHTGKFCDQLAAVCNGSSVFHNWNYWVEYSMKKQIYNLWSKPMIYGATHPIKAIVMSKEFLRKSIGSSHISFYSLMWKHDTGQ